MKAKSIKEKSAEEIRSALKVATSDGFKPTLAIVFLTDEKNINEIAELLRSEKIAVFGCTTSEGFIDENIDNDSIVVLLLNLDSSSFKILFEEITVNSSQKVANKIGKTGKELFSQPAYIVITSGRTVDMDLLMKGLEETNGASVFIFGGRAGAEKMNIDKTIIFNDVSSSANGIITLVIDQEKIQVSGLTSHGWKPLGNEHTITKSVGRTVYTIDDQPALDVFIRFLGVNLNDDTQKEIEYNLDQLGPIQLVRETGNNVIRDVSYFNRNDHSVIFPSNLPEGTKFRFSLPPDFDIIEELPEECLKLKNEKNVHSDAVIMFSCNGRKMALGPMINQEIEKVKDVWESPMAGFFCFGEIGRSEGGGNDFHNFTSCLVILKEK